MQENQVPLNEHIQTPNLEDILLSERQINPVLNDDNEATCDVVNSVSELCADNYRKPEENRIGAAVHGKQNKRTH